MSSISVPILQIIGQQSDDNVKCPPKRARSKSVSWAAREKMLQVRLFAAEDAPSLSGLVSQDLLEAKKAKLTHASSAVDLPPCFGSVATKRAKLDTTAILAMVTQLNWKCPDQFLYDPSWLVAAGDESLEVPAQQHREVRVLEAFYPRVSAIPTSSMEPSEAPSEVDNFHPPQIPLISSEDEEELEPDALLGDKGVARSAFSAANKVTLNWPPAGFTSSTNVENSDPDVAAAAAAAFAVLKAQESGSLIDHDLLIKILSNPLLMQTLKASNTSSKNQCADAPHFVLNKRSDNGNGLIMKQHPLGKGSYVGALGSLSSHIKQERQAGLSHNRGFCVEGISQHGKGILGHGKGAFKITAPREHSNPLPGEDISRKLFPQILTNDALKQSMPPMALRDGKSPNQIERVRPAPITRFNCQPLLESNSTAAAPAIPKKSSAMRDKPPGAKNKRQCFFFHTQRGCRNGIQCNFLHDPPHAEPYLEKVNLPEGAQQVKALKGNIVDTQIQ